MELETIDGIINVNLDSVSLKDVSNINYLLMQV